VVRVPCPGAPQSLHHRWKSVCRLVEPVEYVINNNNDQHQLQNDLQQLEIWEKKWQMQFNADKCFTIHLAKKRKTAEFHHRWKSVCRLVIPVEYVLLESLVSISVFYHECHSGHVSLVVVHTRGYKRQQIPWSYIQLRLKLEQPH
jgi:hypothetical protein